MADPDPSVPQVNDPELEADLIRSLGLVGQVGKLNFLDVVVPVVVLADVRTPTVEVSQPQFRSTDVFSNGKQLAAPINTVLADTGQLAAGTYDILIITSGAETDGRLAHLVEHRDAANAATLMTFAITDTGGQGIVGNQYTFAYEFGADERLRILNDIAYGANLAASATIFASRRT